MANPTSFRALGATTMLAPVPAVLVSCRGTQPPYDRDNLITVAWAGTVCSDPPMLSISVRKSRFSHAQLMQSGCFYVNLVSQELCRATDFCGVRSGRDVDKFAACGLTPVRLDALPETPAVAQAPICLACRVPTATANTARWGGCWAFSATRSPRRRRSRAGCRTARARGGEPRPVVRRACSACCGPRSGFGRFWFFGAQSKC